MRGVTQVNKAGFIKVADKTDPEEVLSTKTFIAEQVHIDRPNKPVRSRNMSQSQDVNNFTVITDYHKIKRAKYNSIDQDI